VSRKFIQQYNHKENVQRLIYMINKAYNENHFHMREQHDGIVFYIKVSTVTRFFTID